MALSSPDRRLRRTRVFINQINGYELSTDEDLVKKGFKFVEIKEDGSFQKDVKIDDSTILFYGEMNDNVPDGKGVLIRRNPIGNGWFPYFAGHFVDGWINGYGIRFVEPSKFYSYEYYGTRITSEGYFNEKDGEKGIYSYLCGEGITYRFPESEYEVNFYASEFKESITKPTVITNFVTKKPSVYYEGEFTNGLLDGHVSIFANNASDDENMKNDSDKTGRSCYGWLFFDGDYIDQSPDYDIRGRFYLQNGSVFEGVLDHYFNKSEFNGDGRLYDAQGRLRYEGTYSGFKKSPYITGSMYDDNGTLKGTYYRGEFTWAEGYIPPENATQEDIIDYSGEFLNQYIVTESFMDESIDVKDPQILESVYSDGLANTSITETNDYLDETNKLITPDFICPNSHTQYLSDDEINKLSNEELRLAINEIYARRGRIYQSEELNSYFLSKAWYDPLFTADEFDESVFNQYEHTNIDRLALKKDGKQLDPVDEVSAKYVINSDQN